MIAMYKSSTHPFQFVNFVTDFHLIRIPQMLAFILVSAPSVDWDLIRFYSFTCHSTVPNYEGLMYATYSEAVVGLLDEHLHCTVMWMCIVPIYTKGESPIPHHVHELT